MAKTPPSAGPSALDAHLGYWLRYVSNHVSGRFQKLLETQGVSVTEWVALRTLWDRQGTTHAELIQALGMTKGAASKIISRLEDKGLARRERQDGSQRDQTLALTAAGRRLLPKLAEVADDNDRHFFGHLDDAQREMVGAIFRQLVAHHGLAGVPVD